MDRLDPAHAEPLEVLHSATRSSRNANGAS
jgi:hypothetical protein